MKYIAPLVLLISFYHTSLAQQPTAGGPGKITGRVVDSATKEALGYAAVAIMPRGTTNIAGGVITDDNGRFTVENLPVGEYKVKVDFLGYKAKVVEGITLTAAKPSATTGDIKVASNSSSMKEVTVTGSRNFMENKLDKFVYNVEKDVTSQGGMATDVLKKLPQVSVDINGNVELLGTGNVRVFVNGKASSQFDNNLAEALQTIPANQIKAIEVITSPGAQYDAQGTGGIINIVLKDNKSQGVNGNVSATVGTRQENATLNLHAHKGNVDLNGYIQRSYTIKSSTLSSQTRIAGTDTLRQTGTGDFQRKSVTGSLGMEWAINKHSTLTAGISMSEAPHLNSNFTDQHSITGTQDTLTLRNAINNADYKSIDWNVGYRKYFDTANQHILELNYQGSADVDYTNYLQSNRYGTSSQPYSGSHGDDNRNIGYHVLSVDYTRPFSKDVTLNTGARATFSNTNTLATHYLLNLNTDQYDYDASQLNKFTYTRDVYAAYTSITVKLGEHYSFKAGLRDEYTYTTFVGDSGKSPSYNTWIPSGVISRKMKGNQTLKLSYSRRIQRPWPGDLDPFINAADPTSLSSGNPYLLPEKVHNVELSYMKSFEKGSSIFVSLYMRYSTEDMQSYITYYDSLQVGNNIYRNVSVSTDKNAGTQQVTGINTSGTLSLSQKLELRCNVTVFNKYIQSNLVAGATSNTFNYRINGNVTYQFTKTLAGEFFGNFRSAQTEIQGKFPSWTSYSFAMRQYLWNKKGSIAFTTNNPFNKYTDQATNVTGTNFTLTSDRKVPNQSFGINFSYRFGKIEYKETRHEGMGENE